MCRLIRTISLLCLPVILWAGTGPETIHSIRKVKMPGAWYVNQAALWKKETEKDPPNAAAWYNYYMATRYGQWYAKKHPADIRPQTCKDIAQAMAAAVPESYEYLLLKDFGPLLQDRSDQAVRIKQLEKALSLKPGDPRVYYDLMVCYELLQEQEKFKKICTSLYESGDYLSAFLEYNYNVIIGLDKNAILFTNGDNDTFPLWLLQQVKGIRPDVLVLNYNLCYILPYLNGILNENGIEFNLKKIKRFDCQLLVAYLQKKYPDRPVYFASTLTRQRLKPFEENLYNVGLTNRFSAKRYDNMAALKKNVEKLFRLDYLSNNWYGDHALEANTIRVLNSNYIPPFTLLADHYKASGENDRADHLQNLIKKLGKK